MKSGEFKRVVISAVATHPGLSTREYWEMTAHEIGNTLASFQAGFSRLLGEELLIKSGPRQKPIYQLSGQGARWISINTSLEPPAQSTIPRRRDRTGRTKPFSPDDMRQMMRDTIQQFAKLQKRKSYHA